MQRRQPRKHLRSPGEHACDGETMHVAPTSTAIADVDESDMSYLIGPACRGPDSAPDCCQSADLDQDNDVDQSDFGIFQRCYSGAEQSGQSNCANLSDAESLRRCAESIQATLADHSSKLHT